MKHRHHHDRMHDPTNDCAAVNAFDRLSETFAEADISQPPAEWHGFLCGAATSQTLSETELVILVSEELASDHTDSSALQQIVTEFAQISLAELNDDNFGFQLILPDDDWPLPDRVEALAAWSEGYLSGLGQSRALSASSMSEESSIALNDIAAISQASTELEETGSEEQDYMELVEYVRIAVLLIHSELRNQHGAAPTPQGSTQLH